MMRIVQDRCPACDVPVFSKNVDMIVQCDRCGMLHTREGSPRLINYRTGELPGLAGGERVYLPVWSLDVVFHIDDIDNKYDILNLYGLMHKDIDKEGKLTMYVPAYDLDAEAFLGMALYLMGNPPAVAPETLDPKVRRLPCIMKSNVAEKLAHFLFVTSVAVKPGVLRDLDYRLTVISVRLLYLLDDASHEGRGPMAEQVRPY